MRRGTIAIAGHEFVVEQLDSTASRTVRVVDTGASPGSKIDVPIVLESQGDENALGFSMAFDPSALVPRQLSSFSISGNPKSFRLP